MSVNASYFTATWHSAQKLIQVENKETIKAPHYWLFVWEFTGNQWIPRKKYQ